MVIRRGAPRRPHHWLLDFQLRARLEADARRELPDLRYRRLQRRTGPVDVWEATVKVDHDVHRLVRVEFDRRFPTTPTVSSTGPTDSPHRYPGRGRTVLCLWYPSDPPSRRWTVNEGLLALFGIAAHHLFKEHWWRQTGEWLGAEAPHDERLGVPLPKAEEPSSATAS